jgi:hypothetical protein
VALVVVAAKVAELTLYALPRLAHFVPVALELPGRVTRVALVTMEGITIPPAVAAVLVVLAPMRRLLGLQAALAVRAFQALSLGHPSHMPSVARVAVGMAQLEPVVVQAPSMAYQTPVAVVVVRKAAQLLVAVAAAM